MSLPLLLKKIQKPQVADSERLGEMASALGAEAALLPHVNSPLDLRRAADGEASERRAAAAAGTVAGQGAAAVPFFRRPFAEDDPEERDDKFITRGRW